MSHERYNEFDLDALATHPKIKQVEYHAILESTNDTALQLTFHNQLQTPALVLTRHQVAGRGRGDHRWQSSLGALTFSLVYRKPGNSQSTAFLSLAAGLSVASNLSSLFPSINFSLKWPNDVFVGRTHKIAGLLIESTPDCIVVGIGINVNNSDLPATATSLQQQVGQSIDLQRILENQISETDRLIQLATSNPAQVILECQQRMLYLSERIELTTGTQHRSGTFSGLDPSGGLILNEDGISSVVHSATGIRPASA